MSNHGRGASKPVNAKKKGQLLSALSFCLKNPPKRFGDVPKLVFGVVLGNAFFFCINFDLDTWMSCAGLFVNTVTLQVVT